MEQHLSSEAVKLPAFYGTRKLITAFAITCHWSISWARWIHFTPS